MKLEPEVQSSVRRITDRFLRLCKPTPMHEIKVKLGPKRSVLNELIRERVISGVGQSYLPCLLAVLEFEHADLQSYCRRCTTMVLNALKQLYADSGPGQFGPDEVFEVIKRMIDPAAETEMVRVGMHFATDFSEYLSAWGNGPDGAISSIAVKDEILDFDTFGNAWEKELDLRKQVKLNSVRTPLPLVSKPEIAEMHAVAQREVAHLNIRLSQRESEVLLECNLLHPTVARAAMPRFKSGHYSDAVEAAIKELNDKVKSMVKGRTKKELDGARLMQHAFSVDEPIIKLSDLTTQSGRDIQIGYQQIFSGVMTGVRNPLSHHPTEIEPNEAVHLLFLVSLLFFKLDTALTGTGMNGAGKAGGFVRKTKAPPSPESQT